MKTVLVLLTGLLLIQCTSTEENTIPIFNNITYQIASGESTTEITSSTVALYDSLFNGKYSEIPLFRSIKHREYAIFIGLPFNTSFEKLYETKKNNIDSSLISETLTDSSFLFKYTTNHAYASEYAVKTYNGSLIFISSLTGNQHIADSLFTVDNFNKRIRIK
jgi:hypothetical protein